MGERLVSALGETIVESAREELICTVQSTSRLELPRTNDAETFAQLGPDDVLPAVSAGQGEIGRLGAHPPGESGQKAGVLVIRMRSDHENSLHAVELTQRESYLDDATALGSDLGRKRRSRKQADHPYQRPTCHRHGSNVPLTPKTGKLVCFVRLSEVQSLPYVGPESRILPGPQFSCVCLPTERNR